MMPTGAEISVYPRHDLSFKSMKLILEPMSLPVRRRRLLRALTYTTTRVLVMPHFRHLQASKMILTQTLS